jgi:hypothetical protein
MVGALADSRSAWLAPVSERGVCAVVEDMSYQKEVSALTERIMDIGQKAEDERWKEMTWQEKEYSGNLH